MNPRTASYKTLLHAAMTAKFVRTKRVWRRLLLLGVTLFLLSAGSAVTGVPSTAARIFECLSLLCGVGVVVLRIHAQHLYGQAEALRREYFQLEGTGVRRRGRTDADLHKTFRAVDLGAIDPERKYYGSSLLPGPNRLADNLEESAFYTRDLAVTTWKLCLVILVLGFGLAFGLLYWAAVLGPDGAGLLTLAPYVVNFIGLGLALDLGVAFYRLAVAATQILERVDILRSSAPMRIEDLLPAITDYDCALAAAGAPIPDFVYAAAETNLDRRWQKLCANRHPDAVIATADVVTEALCLPPRAKIVNFIANRFDSLEFRDFVRNLGDGHLEACLIDSGVQHDAVVREFVASLERQGLIDQQFFTALKAARPARADEIHELARLWLSAKGPHD